MKRYILVIILIIIVIAPSCRKKKIEGNGNIITQVRDFGPFSSIEADDALDLIVALDDNASIKVETDQNIQEYVETYISNNVLSVYTRRSNSLVPSYIKVYVTVPQLERITCNGFADFLTTDTFAQNDFEIIYNGDGEINFICDLDNLLLTAQGSGNINFFGLCDNADIKKYGSEFLNAYELAVQILRIESTGTGDSQVSVSDKLEAEISGSGDIYYKGDPEVVSVTTGTGRLIKVSK